MATTPVTTAVTGAFLDSQILGIDSYMQLWQREWTSSGQRLEASFSFLVPLGSQSTITLDNIRVLEGTNSPINLPSHRWMTIKDWWKKRHQNCKSRVSMDYYDRMDLYWNDKKLRCSLPVIYLALSRQIFAGCLVISLSFVRGNFYVSCRYRSKISRPIISWVLSLLNWMRIQEMFHY